MNYENMSKILIGQDSAKKNLRKLAKKSIDNQDT